MTKKALKEKIRQIKAISGGGDFDAAHSESESLILELFEAKKYSEIVGVDNALECAPITFEVAYSYDSIGKKDKAEELYELILGFPGEEDNTAILNNLSNIKKQKKEFDAAFSLIKKAYSVNPKDEIVARNYQNLERILQEKEQAEASFKAAIDNLHKETEWALGKLKNFYSNIKKEVDYKNRKMAIPRWKFKVLMGVTEEKADSLRDQWVERGYIRNTNERDTRSVIFYETNPFIEDGLKKVIPPKLNPQWFDGFENINQDNLSKCSYFEIIDLIAKVNKKYQGLMRRDFDELTLNYFIKNKKSSIILAGSFIELIFTYHCEKKKIKQISYILGSKIIKRDLYECTLFDFLSYFQEQNSFKSVVLHIGNLAKNYRNFVHPGNELNTQEDLDDSKMEISFHSVIQISKIILK